MSSGPRPVAVHFGAGNIGRGFVGLLLAEARYEVVFADVQTALVEALQAADSYTVHEAGERGRDLVVRGFRALDSRAEADALVDELVGADLVTTAVGPSILRFVAAPIAAALRRRPPDAAPLGVLACENAIRATGALRQEVAALLADDERDAVLARAAFADTAVDRIVPAQDPTAGLDVTVEDFFEWVIERGAFGGAPPVIPGAVFVDDLAPYIERKLFTVNTGHAALAYHGRVRGAETLAEALALPDVAREVDAVLAETSALLVAKHEFEPEAQAAYRRKTLTRFGNPWLADHVLRVGRAPLRKLSRRERFIAPAAELAERGLPTDALVGAVRAALAFDVRDDPETVELRALLGSDDTDEQLAGRITGLDRPHPLFSAIVDAVHEARRGRPPLDE